MTKNEWNLSKNAGSMIEYLWQKEPLLSIKAKFRKYPPAEDWKDYLDLEMPLYKFYLASCRNIWQLLPQEASRKGVELAEQFISGSISWEHVSM